MFVGGRRLGLAPLAVLLVLSLAGCGGSSDKAATLPPLSQSPSTTPPTSPAQNPKAAAVAVVREYFRLINALPKSMNSGPIARLMTPSCTCRQQIRAIDRAKAMGEHYIDHWRNLTLTPALTGKAGADVLARYDATAGGLVDAHGRKITSAAPRTGVQRLFRLVNSSGHWRIDEIQAA